MSKDLSSRGTFTAPSEEKPTLDTQDWRLDISTRAPETEPRATLSSGITSPPHQSVSFDKAPDAAWLLPGNANTNTIEHTEGCSPEPGGTGHTDTASQDLRV